MQNLLDLLTEVIEPLWPTEVEPIYSRVDEVRKRAIRAITERFPESIRQEAKQWVPIKFLEFHTFEWVLAASSWLTELIVEGKVDHSVIDSVYGALYLEYIHSNHWDETNKADALDVRERVWKIVTILKWKKVQGKISDTNTYIDKIEAQYEFDFHENYERSIEILEPMVERGDEWAVLLLWNVYEKSSQMEKAKALYRKWAEWTWATLYYRALISGLWNLGEHEAASQWYDDYRVLAKIGEEEVVPFIVLKESIDRDDDLKELGSVLTDIFANKNFETVYVPILAKARSYVEREIQGCLMELNKLWVSISERANTFSVEYSNAHFQDGISDNLMSWEYHYLWVRLLFLYAINALVLFDNTPLRAYDVFSKDGDLVLPKSVRETLEQVVSLENMDEPGRENERSPLPNPGKVEEFLDLVIELNKSEEGAHILTEFFTEHRFRSITRVLDQLESQYEKEAQGLPNQSKPRWANLEKSEEVQAEPEEGFIAFSSTLRSSDLTIILPWTDEVSEDEEWLLESSDDSWKEDDTDDDIFIGVPGKWDAAKLQPLEDILFFLNSVYISPDHRAIQERAFVLYDGLCEDVWAPIERTRRVFARMDHLEKTLMLSGDAVIEEYERVRNTINEQYGATLYQSVLYFASESVTLKVKIPEFVLNDYYLAWHLLVSHLFCADTTDDDLVKDLLNQSVFYIDYLEWVEDLNSIIITALVHAWLYDLACDFMIRTRIIMNPPTFSLFLSCLSYLDEVTQNKFFDELDTEILPEYEWVEDIEWLIDAMEWDINKWDEFESDDRVRCDLSRAYLYLIEKNHSQAAQILSDIDEKRDDQVPDMVVAEIEFLRIRLEVEAAIQNGSTAFFEPLDALYERLDIEYKTECMSYLLRMSFRKETEASFKIYYERAIEDRLHIGLWKYAYGLLCDDETLARESLAWLSTADLTFMPPEMRRTVIDKCLNWKYQKTPLSELGDMRLQSAFILSNFAFGESSQLDAILQYSVWLNHYLKPKNGQYTTEELEELIETFETSFWYAEWDPWASSSLTQKLSHFLLKHYQYFCEEFTQAQVLHKKAYPKIPFPEDQYNIWKKATRNFIEILQRFHTSEIESIIADIRISYHLNGDDFPNTQKGNISLESQYIH